MGILSFCSSVRYKGVGIYLPSLGEGPGVGILSFCSSVRCGVGFYLPSLGEGLGVGVSPLGRGRGWVLVTPRMGQQYVSPGHRPADIGATVKTSPKGAKE